MVRPCEVVVDNRERDLIAALARQGTAHATQVMPVGDLAFYRDGRALLLVERKTWADLAGSIVDGRYAEQKGRLLAARAGADAPAVAYLLEGPEPGRAPRAFSRVDTATLLSAQASMTLRDGFSLLCTSGVADTATLVRLLRDRLSPGAKNPLRKPARPGAAAAAAPAAVPVPAPPALSKQWAQSGTPGRVYARQLMCVESVSRGAAAAVAAAAPDAKRLRALLREDGAVADIVPRGKKRRLGPALEQKLRAAFV
jgi:hypothetical protein